MYCYNNDELRNKYLSLIMFNDIFAELERQGKPYSRQKQLDILKPLKAEIRDTYKLRNKYNDPNKYPQWRTPFGRLDEWDSRMCKYEEPYILEPREIDGYIKETWQHWYNPYNDGRDCTGVWFTTCIKVFPIPSRGVTIIYHYQSQDV